MEKAKLFECCCRQYPWLTVEIFNEIISLLHSATAITGYTDKYVYQTTSSTFPHKTIEEVISTVRQ
jgi:hypothetical protein